VGVPGGCSALEKGPKMEDWAPDVGRQRRRRRSPSRRYDYEREENKSAREWNGRSVEPRDRDGKRRPGRVLVLATGSGRAEVCVAGSWLIPEDSSTHYSTDNQMVIYALYQRLLNGPLNLKNAAKFSIYRVSLNGPIEYFK
jgi:hypothetical protein